MQLSTDELVRLAPKQWAYLRTPTPTWPDIVDTADWLCHDLGVSKPLWGEVCMAMGYEVAAIALAIVSANPAGHFTSSPGGYFYGMVAKAKASELNSARAADARARSASTAADVIQRQARDPRGQAVRKGGLQHNPIPLATQQCAPRGRRSLSHTAFARPECVPGHGTPGTA